MVAMLSTSSSPSSQQTLVTESHEARKHLSEVGRVRKAGLHSGIERGGPRHESAGTTDARMHLMSVWRQPYFCAKNPKQVELIQARGVR
jgi:hypothetical protein